MKSMTSITSNSGELQRWFQKQTVLISIKYESFPPFYCLVYNEENNFVTFIKEGIQTMAEKTFTRLYDLRSHKGCALHKGTQAEEAVRVVILPWFHSLSQVLLGPKGVPFWNLFVQEILERIRRTSDTLNRKWHGTVEKSRYIDLGSNPDCYS